MDQNLYTSTEKVQPVSVSAEMKKSFIDYAMSVIISRALPEVRDGLKPVHRRVLYAMFREGLLHNRKYSKCAGVVGEVLKKYHPHGDSAVYDTLVRMAQPWSMRYPLVDGQGNFGSIDGDSAAAYRYTECRMTALAEEMLADIDKDTVDFMPNFDETVPEPTVLPTKVPQLLLNGTSGIAVGMATNVPPHNLGELCDALIMFIKNPEVSLQELMTVLPGPDFPTGGIICGNSEIINMYKTGRGRLKIRGAAGVEPGKMGKDNIVITEIPYTVNKANLVTSIAELVNDKKITGISDLRDESSKEGIRIVVELKRGEIPDVVLNQLYKHTQLQMTFGAILIAIEDGQPRTVGLKQCLHSFVNHRKEVVTRRSAFDLAKAEKRAHVVEGFLKALDMIDKVVALIRGSKDREEARVGLINKLGFTEPQAVAILDMRLYQLTGLERGKLEDELKELEKEIAFLKSVLSDEKVLIGLIIDELEDLKKRYSDERRTALAGSADDLKMEDLIANETTVITVTHSGYIKRCPVSAFRSQHRGGSGIRGVGTKEEDFVEQVFTASTHDYLFFFTSAGKVYWLKAYEIPQMPRDSRGKAIVNLLQVESGEKISAILRVTGFNDTQSIILCTRKGLVKKTKLNEFRNMRKSGLIAINLEDDDTICTAKMTGGNDDVILFTRNGMSIRFSEQDARDLGRNTKGVRGIKLENNDYVIGMEVVSDENTSVLVLTEQGYGKRTTFHEYHIQRRAGKGLIAIKTTDRNGKVVSAFTVDATTEIVMVTQGGQLIRTRAGEFREIGRNTQGVLAARLDEGDSLVAAARVFTTGLEEAEEEGEEESGPTQGELLPEENETEKE